MSNKSLFGFSALWAAVVVALVLVVGNCSALTMEEIDNAFNHYEDSVAAAQKAEKAAINLPAPETITETGPSAPLTMQEALTIDSFQTVFNQSEKLWNKSTRLREVVLTSDRIAALSFYLKKSVMTKTEVEKYALILQSEKQTEREGTLFLIAHQHGKEQVKAHAHLIKLRGEISAVENFLYALHDEKVTIDK